jgi:hypothetical protein
MELLEWNPSYVNNCRSFPRLPCTCVLSLGLKGFGNPIKGVSAEFLRELCLGAAQCALTSRWDSVHVTPVVEPSTRIIVSTFSPDDDDNPLAVPDSAVYELCPNG